MAKSSFDSDELVFRSLHPEKVSREIVIAQSRFARLTASQLAFREKVLEVLKR